MEGVRTPFQGIWNIIRFNRHFFITSLAIIVLFFLIGISANEPLRSLGSIMAVCATVMVLTPLIVSFYVYDLSDLYRLKWLDGRVSGESGKIVNIHSGFDETSILIKKKFTKSTLLIFDFYNSETHTEVSIKRARKAYPVFPGTKQVSTSNIPLPENDADAIFVILSAHEIRCESERDIFFSELGRVVKTEGRIIVAEHLRDWRNLLAYNVGFFHFIPKKSWYKAFNRANLTILEEVKVTPFITTFILQKYGTSS